MIVSFFALVAVAFLASCNAGQTGNPTAAPAATPKREVSPLQLEEQIPVPTVAGRLDDFTSDNKRRLLIFSALGNNSVEIINVFDGRVVHSIKGKELNEPQGSLYVPGGRQDLRGQCGKRLNTTARWSRTLTGRPVR